MVADRDWIAEAQAAIERAARAGEGEIARSIHGMLKERVAVREDLRVEACEICSGTGRIILSPGEGAACDACDATGARERA